MLAPGIRSRGQKAKSYCRNYRMLSSNSVKVLAVMCQCALFVDDCWLSKALSATGELSREFVALFNSSVFSDKRVRHLSAGN